VARRAKGEVVVREWRAGRGFALRFGAYGRRRYVTLGLEADGWTFERATEELENVLADVRRGLWVPPRRGGEDSAPALPARRGSEGGGRAPSLAGGEMLFSEFAPWALEVRRVRNSEESHRKRCWGLRHLMPFFAEWPLAEIDAEAVDSYSFTKVEEGERLAAAIERGQPFRDERGHVRKPLAASSINTTIKTLSWLLGLAVQYKRIPENPAAGRERLLRARPKPPVHLDTAEQVEALLDAAAELDRDPSHHCTEREAIVTMLIFAGPRAHELGNMLERDIDLANDRIMIGRSKTAAGLREIRVLPILRDVLAAHKVRPASGGPDALAFPTERGTARDKNNLASRVLGEVLERADLLLRERGELPLPKGLSPHKLRHAFASILVACGTDPASVMRQIGHRSAAFTLDVYTHTMATSPEQRERLQALVNGERRWGPAPPSRLGSPAYKEPILRALAAAGGSARRSVVLAAVEAEMSGCLGIDDHELVGDKPRWQADFDVACRRLRERGLVVRGRREGIWKLTKADSGQADRGSRGIGRRTSPMPAKDGGGSTRSVHQQPLRVAA
jgi:integrase